MTTAWQNAMKTWSSPAITNKAYTGATQGTYKPKSNISPVPPKTSNIQQPQQPQQPQSSWQPQSVPSYSGGFNFKMPSLPEAPVVTQKMINQWIERAKNEAGLTYDPQVLAIQQELAKALLQGEQSKTGIPQYYQDILDYINEWKTEETKAEQQRQYARGFGRSGALLEQENKIAEEALKQGTKAETEKAQKLSDIDAQLLQLQEQAGQKLEGVETARGQYVSARKAELQDAYEANQTALSQQRFANQMAIQQFGLTAETQAFDQWLSQMEMANEINYQNQMMQLQQQSQQRASNYVLPESTTTGTGGIYPGAVSKGSAYGDRVNIYNTGTNGQATTGNYGGQNASAWLANNPNFEMWKYKLYDLDNRVS